MHNFLTRLSRLFFCFSPVFKTVFPLSYSFKSFPICSKAKFFVIIFGFMRTYSYLCPKTITYEVNITNPNDNDDDEFM